MPANANISIPVETLLAMLRAEGIRDIGVTSVLDIQKVLASLNENEIHDYKKIKYYIRPIVCRNKEDQEKFNLVFDKYIQWIASEKLNITRPVKKKKYIPWWWITLISALAIAMLLFLLKPEKQDQFYLSISQQTLWPAGKYAEVAIGDSVEYTLYINDSSAIDQYSVEWRLNNKHSGNTRTVTTVYRDTGNYLITASALNQQTGTVLTDSIYTTVKCDHPPILNIRRETKNGKKKYVAVPGDTTSISKKYTYKWYLNDSLVTAGNEFVSMQTSNKTYTVKLIADTRGLYSCTDSLITRYDETPVYQLLTRSLQPVATGSSLLVRNILYLLGLLIILPAAVMAYIYKQWKIPKAKQHTQAVLPSKGAADNNDRQAGPFAIAFKSQDYKIDPGEQVNRLADGLRKRQLSDTLQLNLKKSICKTIKAGGFPTFEFSPKTKPVDFLILIDKEYPDSHLVKLFEFVIERLRAEQVNIIVYDYYKEPLYLNNTRFNHVRLPLDRVIQLYPDSILLMFSHAHYLLEPHQAKIKEWAEEKLKQWETQVIITPVPKKDWSYKEIILQRSGLVLIPADLYQNNVLRILLDVISLQVETTKQDKIEISETYSARYYNFQDFDALSEYLANEALLEWVCATAVYPHVDWNVTLAIGSALENTGKQKKLITYENLLKISRISWMQDAVIDDELRLEMLRHISNTTETIARKAIVVLLEEIKDTFKENSFAKEEYDLHHHSNLFLLYANDQAEPMPDEILMKVTDYLKKGYFDWPYATYNEEAVNTLIRQPNTTSSIPINRYLNELNIKKAEKDRQRNDEQLQKEKEAQAKRRRIKMLRNIIALSTFILLVLSTTWLLYKNGLFTFRKITRQSLEVTLHNTTLLNAFGEISLSIQTDSIYTGKKVNDSVYTFPGIVQASSGRQPLLIINQKNSPALTAAISIDSTYDAYIMEPELAERKRLSIFYNNKTNYDAVQQQLSDVLGMYDIAAAQSAFRDSSMIIYFNDQRAMADSIADIIKKNLGIGIAVIMGAGNNDSSMPELYLNMDPAAYACNIISFDAVPLSLNNTWWGAANNRFARIDIASKLIYYSTGEKSTYGTYAIDEICFDQKGTYRFLVRANNRYRVFFLKNVKDISFNVSLCENWYNSKAEITNVDEATCNKFNNMTLYFTNTSPNIVSANIEQHFNFSTGQRDKLDKIFAGVEDTDTIKIELNINAGGSNIPADQRFTALQKDFPTGPTRVLHTTGYNIKNNIIQWSRKDFTGTPFDRDFAVVQINKARANVNPCNYTYYSMQEALRVADPLQICRLNLEKEQLTALPAQLYNFKNLQELTLGTTSIPRAEIEQLQKALPKCRIDFTISPAQEKPGNTSPVEETQLVQLNLDSKYNLDKKGIPLISNIARQLTANTSNKIKLRVTVQAPQEKMMVQALSEIKNMFYKEGVRPGLNQIDNDIIISGNANSLVKPRAATKSKAQNANGTIVYIIGINWKEAESKKAY